MRVLFPEAAKDEAVILYNSGQSLYKVGQELGVSDTTVLRWLRERGIERRTPSQAASNAYPQSTKERGIALYISGKSCEKVANEIGVSRHAVQKWIKDAGVKVTRRNGVKYPQSTKDKAASRYIAGDSGPKIEKDLGVTSSTITRWMHDRGIMRTASEAQKALGLKGENTTSWKGDDAGYGAQHSRAIQDFPEPLGDCGICLIKPAIYRARIDSTNLPYRKEYVLPMCIGCNARHRSNHFVILFEEIK